MWLCWNKIVTKIIFSLFVLFLYELRHQEFGDQKNKNVHFCHLGTYVWMSVMVPIGGDKPLKKVSRVVKSQSIRHACPIFIFVQLMVIDTTFLISIFITIQTGI